MNLIKTSLLNGVAVVIKMATLLGINKILAIYVGPAGYAAIGQFQNAVQMIITFASGAINTGVTKYTAEYGDDEEKQHKVWRTAGTIAFIGSLFSAIFVALFSEELASWFLNDAQYSGVFIWFAATLLLFTFNTLLLAILNGKKEIARYVVANISGSIFSLIITTIMSIQYGLYGALVSLAIYQSLSFVVTLLICFRASWFKLNYFFGGIDRTTAFNLSKYAVMALISAACAPLTHILIRNHLGSSLGWESAGYWEAMWRLSGAYLMLVTSTLSVYYLPRLSELKTKAEIKKEILSGYKIILPTTIACGIILYLLRDFVIKVLFSVEFSAMEVLFAWQIMGDILKIGSWIIAFLMLSKALIKEFIITEISFSILFYFLTLFFIEKFGLQGVAIAHCINYLIYWIVVVMIIKSKLTKMSSGNCNEQKIKEFS